MAYSYSNPEDKLDDEVYGVLDNCCRNSGVSLNDNTIEIDPSTVHIDSHVKQILKLVDEYCDENFMVICKNRGFRDVCDHCEDRFVCWTTR